MSALHVSWWNWVAATSVQIVVVVAVVALLERLLTRRAHPKLAAALWLVALAKLAAPPTLESPLSLARLAPSDVEIVPAAPAFAAAAFWIWIAGAALCAALAVRRHARLRRELLAGSAEASETVAAGVRDAARRLGLRRPPRVREVPGLDLPCVFGHWRPVILVPAGGANAHALLHEVAHVRRRDPLASLPPLAMQILFWFHPAAWIIRSRLATLREVACDAEVAGVLGGRAPEYRRMLADFARGRLGASIQGVTALAFGRSRLVERLEWLSPRLRCRGRAGRLAAAMAAAVVLAACVPLARSAPPPFTWPTIDQTQGCLQRRFVVLEALSRQP